jgi:hypothetical protein
MMLVRVACQWLVLFFMLWVLWVNVTITIATYRQNPQWTTLWGFRFDFAMVVVGLLVLTGAGTFSNLFHWSR